MYKIAWCTCKVVVLLTKTDYFFCRSPCRRPRGFCFHPEIVLPWWRDVPLLLSVILHVSYLYFYDNLFIHRGYYTVARRYEFYFRVAKQYFTNERNVWFEYCFCPEKIKFISSSRRVMFFLSYRQKDIDKIIEGNYRNYVIDKLTCDIVENKPLGSRMQFSWILLNFIFNKSLYFSTNHTLFVYL